MNQEIGLAARFDGVALRYGQGPEVLRDISFELPVGSFHFLLGPSGAGKTSLLRLLSLAMMPSRGRVEVFGENVATASRPTLRAIRRRTGIVFQDFRLLPHLSVFDNVALPLRLASVDEAQVYRDIDRLLIRIGLRQLADTLPPSLSGGQQQLVAIARAVAVRPRLLIADEPTASVDESLAVRLVLLFNELNRLGTTVLIATHSQALAQRFGHPRLHIEKGALVAPDEPPSLAGAESRAARSAAQVA